MGTSSIKFSKLTASRGGGIKVRVGDYFIPKLIAQCYSIKDLRDFTLQFTEDKETKRKMQENIFSLLTGYIGKHIFFDSASSLEGKIDLISFITDESSDRDLDCSRKFTLTNGFKVTLGLTKSKKENTLLRLVINCRQLKLGAKCTLQDIKDLILKDDYPGNKSIDKFVIDINEELSNVIDGYMSDKEVSKYIDNHKRKTDMKESDNFMDAYCPQELESLVKEGLKYGHISYRIAKGPLGKNVAVIYPTAKSFIEHCASQIKDDSKSLVKLKNEPGFLENIFNEEEKVNINLKFFKEGQINSFADYCNEKKS